jgi:polyribonucleotide nucleotidyltransferase
MQYQKCTFDFFNNSESFEFGKVAKQADGSVLYQEEDTVILAAVTVDDSAVEEDFLPLTVSYVEKTYAFGKFPGGFIKREAKPSEFETLTSRIVDRSVRPLFPKGFTYPVVLTITVLSCDPEADLQRLALNAANAALACSSLPIAHNITGVRIAKVDNEFIVNPSYSKLQESTLDLFVAGTDDQLLMIEMKANASDETRILEPVAIDPIMDPVAAASTFNEHCANELDESELLEALNRASSAIATITEQYSAQFNNIGNEKANYELRDTLSNNELYSHIKENYLEKIKSATNQMAKTERSNALKLVRAEILASDIATTNGWEKDLVSEVLGGVKREIVRSQIVNERVRADGRALNEVRPIAIETNILPRAHASVLFTRGATQALAVLTLGSDQDRQSYDLLNSKTANHERFMLHYNFPGYSVGEAKRPGPVGRRELGHGNLGKRAVEPTIPSDFDQSIRVVSEILESNGSSSMATVCAASLALKAADVPSNKLVAGVAMGLVIEEEKYGILTDIMGLEDHDGDMDFKVAGTNDGITALQMDIKLGGVNFDILKEALTQAKEARLHILGLMESAKEEIVLNDKALPSVHNFIVDTHKIVDIIGQAGKTIREIIEKFEVNIDLDRDKGGVKVQGASKEGVMGAVDHIKDIVSKSTGRPNRNKEANKPVTYIKGELVEGKVEKILKFGALVKLPDGNVGMCHISKLSNERVHNVESVLSEHQEVKVHFIEQGKDGKISLALEGVKF